MRKGNGPLLGLIGIIVILLVVIFILMYSAVDSSNETKNAPPSPKTLTEGQAQKIALSQIPGTLGETELEQEGSQLIWSVDVITGANEYSLDIDARTGEVIEITKETIQTEPVVVSTVQSSGTTSTSSSTSTKKATKQKITEEEAKSIALEKVPGRVTDVEREMKRGKQVYAVEIDADAGSETDVLIDDYGTIVGIEAD